MARRIAGSPLCRRRAACCCSCATWRTSGYRLCCDAGCPRRRSAASATAGSRRRSTPLCCSTSKNASRSDLCHQQSYYFLMLNMPLHVRVLSKASLWLLLGEHPHVTVNCSATLIGDIRLENLRSFYPAVTSGLHRSRPQKEHTTLLQDVRALFFQYCPIFRALNGVPQRGKAMRRSK